MRFHETPIFHGPGIAIFSQGKKTPASELTKLIHLETLIQLFDEGKNFPTLLIVFGTDLLRFTFHAKAKRHLALSLNRLDFILAFEEARGKITIKLLRYSTVDLPDDLSILVFLPQDIGETGTSFHYPRFVFTNAFDAENDNFLAKIGTVFLYRLLGML